MSEVKRYMMREWGLPPGRKASSDYDLTFVFAEDYDAAQSELAALREELASVKKLLNQAQSMVNGATDEWHAEVKKIIEEQ